MALKRIHTIPFKRKRIGVTNYRKRLRFLLSNRNRLVIRKSLKNILVQVISYSSKGDIILVSAHSSELKKLGWPYQCDSIPAAYLIGFLAGKKAQKKNLKEAILDMGLYPSKRGSKIYASLKGVIDSGFNTPVNEKMFPSLDRIKGLHIKKYAELPKGNGSTQFSYYLKKGILLQDIDKKFDEVKNKINSL